MQKHKTYTLHYIQFTRTIHTLYVGVCLKYLKYLNNPMNSLFMLRNAPVTLLHFMCESNIEKKVKNC